jgi:hypothetical protein
MEYYTDGFVRREPVFFDYGIALPQRRNARESYERKFGNLNDDKEKGN